MKKTKIQNSSNIAEVGYDAINKVLDVTFHDGGTYRYHGVPADKHEALVRAPSAGKFLNAEIKGKFRHEKV